MRVSKIISKLAWPISALKYKGLKGINSRKDFYKIIEHERERANRNNHQVSLVVFNLESFPDNGRESKQLIKNIIKEKRKIDELGWYQKHRVGVILPYTPSHGARKFSVRLSRTLNFIMPDSFCYLFTYPLEEKTDDDENKANDQAESKADNDVENTDADIDNNTDDYVQNTSVGSVSLWKDFSTLEDTSLAGKYEIDSTSEEGKIYSLFKKIETIEPFFVRRIPAWKRTLDIFGSFFGLIILSPLFLLIAILIKIVSPGPVFFKQTRIGYGAKEFNFWKFRTMKVNADTSSHEKYLSELINEDDDEDEEGVKPMIKQDRDNPNIIPFGHFLRCSCLDELPQLVNVLLGDMSLVGPRPPIPYEVEEYLIWHKGRFDGLPGMTGLWQVSGKNRLTFKEMIRLDIQYERQMSLLTDLKILLMTPFAILNEYRCSRQDTCS